MARLARVVVPGVPHHLTQRGNRREDVFFGDVGRECFLALLAKYARQHSLGLWAYCLMSNHVHLIVVPQDVHGLGRAMRAVNAAYARYVNERQGLCGHLWQGRFFSCPLDVAHQWSAVRYVERNPVRAKIVLRAEDYAWSSAAAHCGLRGDPLLSGDLERADHVGDWSASLRDEDETELAAIRRHTRTGRPLGPDEFVRRVGSMLGRSLARSRPGPKRKRKSRRDTPLK